MLTGTIVAFFLVWFLAPRFAHVYEGMTPADLAVLSAWLLKIGLFVSDHTLASLGCLLGLPWQRPPCWYAPPCNNDAWRCSRGSAGSARR